MSGTEFKILPNVLHVWIANLASLSVHPDDLNLLSHTELKRASTYKLEKDKKCFILTRSILRKIIGYYLNISPSNIDFFYNLHGKPFLNTRNERNNLYFNLSHSGDLVLYIFARNYYVGIDVEKLNYIEGFEDIAKQFFSSSEYLNFQSIPCAQKLEAFFKCWTRKEAFIKAIGNGLSYPLNQFAVSLDPNESAKLLSINGDPSLASHWSLYSFMPYSNYEVAFAVCEKYTEVEFFQYQDSHFRKYNVNWHAKMTPLGSELASNFRPLQVSKLP